MMLLKNKKVQVGDMTFYVRDTNRAKAGYFQYTGKNEVDDLSDGLAWFYFSAQAGAKNEGVDFPYETVDSFIDAIDDYPEAMVNFANAVGVQKKKTLMTKRDLLILVIYTVFAVGLWELIRYIFGIIFP